MSFTFGAAIGSAVAIGTRRHRLGAATAAVAWQPAVAGVGAAMWFLGLRWRALAGAKRSRAESGDDVVVFAELVALGIGAGLSLGEAVRRAAIGVGGSIGDEATSVLRRARISGNALAFAQGSEHLGSLFRLVSRSTATGAPLAPAVAAYVAEVRKQRAAERAAAIKRLPVRLLLPLTLLILPGFVVLTLGPALLSGLQRVQL